MFLRFINTYLDRPSIKLDISHIDAFQFELTIALHYSRGYPSLRTILSLDIIERFIALYEWPSRLCRLLRFQFYGWWLRNASKRKISSLTKCPEGRGILQRLTARVHLDALLIPAFFSQFPWFRFSSSSSRESSQSRCAKRVRVRVRARLIQLRVIAVRLSISDDSTHSMREKM